MHDSRRWSLPAVIGATGIVYGDIGTSPLYALETALNATGTFDALAVLGVLSLIFWSLMLSVTFKYVTIMMRADNQGEGGILALFALAQRAPEATRGWFKWLIGLALAGTGLPRQYVVGAHGRCSGWQPATGRSTTSPVHWACCATV